MDSKMDTTEEVESVHDDDDVKTVDLFPWRWNIEMPHVTVHASIPGWFLILVFVLFARGPVSC